VKILVSFRHRKAVEPFVGAVETLAARGHAVTVAVHERDDKVARLFGPGGGVGIVTFSDRRRDEWSESAALLRHARDLVQYLRAPYRDAHKLRRRVFERLLKELAVSPDAGAAWSADALAGIGEESAARLDRVLAHLEQSMPADAVTMRALARLAPDVVLATPLLHFGSTQVDVVKAARALGIPVGMLLFSWDNLSTKGALHVAPDHLFVWNARQRDEAWQLHGIPPERVTLTGAPRFDRFFSLSSRVPHVEFCAPLGADPAGAIVLYLCSSRLVAERETRFLRHWVRAIRASPSPRLRDACLVVRPHPDLPLAEGARSSDPWTFRWHGVPDVELRAVRLFGDAGVVMLTSDYGAGQVLFESIYHAGAVVGLNTSAEIEAGIVGRPVFTVVAGDEHADGQTATLHFHYLTRSQGGFVRVAASLAEHVAELAAELDAPQPPSACQAQVAAFVRPCGWDRPAADVLADAVMRVFAPRGVEVAAANVTVNLARGVEVVAGAAAAGAIGEGRAHDTAPPPGVRRIPAAAAAVRVSGSDVELWAISDDGRTPRLPASTGRALAWLADRLAPGQVLYDLTAGRGLFAVSAARAIGCTVLAFETNLVALYELWQNVLLNACDGLVVPVPLGAGSRTALRIDRFARLGADASRVTPRMTRWREHDPGRGPEILQPWLTVPLPWAANRWKLPLPRAVRATLESDEGEVLTALEGLVAEPAFEMAVLEAPPSRLAAASARLARAGLTPVPSSTGGRDDVLGYNRPSAQPREQGPCENDRLT
jgi:hypothetical protein